MTSPGAEWVLLVYRIPTHPSRLRLQVWRTLLRMGGVYIQDAACILPWRPDLVENMQYVSATIEEMGGTSHLFSASSLLPDGSVRIEEEFRLAADRRLDDIVSRLESVEMKLEEAASANDLERVEEDIKRERIAYLRARRLSYFGSNRESDVDSRLDTLLGRTDDLHRTK